MAIRAPLGQLARDADFMQITRPNQIDRPARHRRLLYACAASVAHAGHRAFEHSISYSDRMGNAWAVHWPARSNVLRTCGNAESCDQEVTVAYLPLYDARAFLATQSFIVHLFGS